MAPEEIQQLRKELGCTARELATTLGIDPKEVAAWEAGELFPTKRLVQAMQNLKAQGPSAVVRAPKGKAVKRVGLDRLSDPTLWKLLRKLIDHPQLFDEVQALAAKYPDPPENKA